MKCTFWRKGVCESCPTGRWKSVSGDEACSACGPGKYLPTRGASSLSSCLPCERGKASATLGASDCVECSAGKLSTSPQASLSCITSCASSTGYYSHPSSTTASCELCPKGTESKSGVCQDCQAGEFSASLSNPVTALTPYSWFRPGKWSVDEAGNIIWPDLGSHNHLEAVCIGCKTVTTTDQGLGSDITVQGERV